MTPEQFVYWLQGYVEIAKPQERLAEYYDVAAWQEIKNHLDLVLHKQTPVLNKYGQDMLARELTKPVTGIYPLPPAVTC